ncbi:MAG TPA: hypothetical protein VLE53_05460 [Gemmatimonadaceae bacterium]|nr:hypothetical protein [Gemmatimonadaceae bacterium]
MTRRSSGRGVARPWAGTALLIALAAPALRAQDAHATLPASLRQGTRMAVMALADSLTREGLPGGGLYAKAAEGVLKGADDARVLEAVRSVASRLREARRALGPHASAADLEAGASALFAGVSPGTLARFSSPSRPASRTQTLANTLTVLADLVWKGVPVERVTQSIEALTARGAYDRHLTALRAAFDQELNAGRDPIASLNRGTAQVLRALDRPSSP